MKDFIEYSKARAHAVKIIRSKKRESYKTFVGSINRFSNMKFVWNKVRILKNAKSRVTWNDWPVGDREKTILEEIDKIVPPWMELKRMDSTDFRNTTDKYGLNKDFTFEEIQRSIRKTRSKSSQGLDYIDNVMVKRLSHPIVKELLNIFNQLYGKGNIIDEWMDQMVFFIQII